MYIYMFVGNSLNSGRYIVLCIHLHLYKNKQLLTVILMFDWMQVRSIIYRVKFILACSTFMKNGKR